MSITMPYRLTRLNHTEFFKQFISFEKYINYFVDKNVETVTKGASLDFVNLHKNIKEFIKQNLYPAPEILFDLIELYKFEEEHSGSMAIVEELRPPKNITPKRNFKIYNVKKFKIAFNTFSNYLNSIESLKANSHALVLNTISEKYDFLLNKLYTFKTDEYYSVKMFFELNEIQFRENETIEIAKQLLKKGFVSINNGWEEYNKNGTDSIKITVKGSEYVERTLKQRVGKKSDQNIDARIDSVIEMLEKLGLGQEVIFNEIEELRELHSKLSKKSWTQLLKSKLVDLVSDQFINKENAEAIYETLSDEALKLIT